MPIEITLSEDMIEQVMREWDAKNLGREMTSEEFADAMMKKTIGSAKVVE